MLLKYIKVFKSYTGPIRYLMKHNILFKMHVCISISLHKKWNHLMKSFQMEWISEIYPVYWDTPVWFCCQIICFIIHVHVRQFSCGDEHVYLWVRMIHKICNIYHWFLTNNYYSLVIWFSSSDLSFIWKVQSRFYY